MKVFAHRHKYRHDRRRKVLHNMLKRGDVKLLQETQEGWLYEIDPKLKKELAL